MQDAPYKLLTRQLPLSEELIATCNVVEHPGSIRNGEQELVGTVPFKDHSPTYLMDQIISYPPLYSLYSNYESMLGDRYEVANERGRLWNGEPSFTTFAQWKGTLDYIFVVQAETGPKLVGSELKLLPLAADLLPSIPNEKFGSDHVMLRAIVEFSANQG